MVIWTLILSCTSDIIWPARITRVVGTMLWLHFDTKPIEETEAELTRKHHVIIDARSLDLYPVGWCQVNILDLFFFGGGGGHLSHS